MEPLLRVEHLEKQFARGGLFRAGKGISALTDVSFLIYPKTTLALVGESGSGKSTLALCVACLEKPTGGSIRFENTEITSLKEKQLRSIRRRVQLVFQDPSNSLNPRRTVQELVTEPLNIQRRLGKREKSERARELLELVSIPAKKALQRPDELSGGQKQRVAIARALALQPKLLILDEALSSLDCSIQAQIANLLLDLQSTLGLTYFFITHDFRMAAHLADEVAVMERGQIVELGKAQRVLHSPGHPVTRQLVAASLGFAPKQQLPEAR
jgi:ABC-type glutathione transport system ATPase component